MIMVMFMKAKLNGLAFYPTFMPVHHNQLRQNFLAIEWELVVSDGVGWIRGQ
jgi:hypothetical protein